MSGKARLLAATMCVSLATTGCSSIASINGTRMNASTAPDATYCDKNPEVCVVAALLVVGGAVAIVAHGDHDGGSSEPPNGNDSDGRLKRDIVPVATLDNGLKLYAFRYNWSDERYVGVMAQDLLGQVRFRGAVVQQDDGYYSVSYAKLGLRMTTYSAWRDQGLTAVYQPERMAWLQALQPSR